MKLSTILSSAAAAAALSLAGAASAHTIYDNPYVLGNNGDCSWSTTCASIAFRGDDFAAQEFTLTKAVVITGATFTELDLGTTPTDMNWGFIAADGLGGLPGTILAAGTDIVGSTTVLGTDNLFGTTYNITKGSFNVGTVALGPGTYYVALQGISSDFNTFLGFGAAASGAAETFDGGLTWQQNYELASWLGGPTDSVAVGLFGAVPEPGTWALMLIGIGGLGAALRRQRKAAVAA